MHRSRLRQLVVDCEPSSYDAAVAFWSSALGATAQVDDDEPEYAELHGHPGALTIGLQRLGEGTPARVHLDVEADDVEAEVARLVGLGATEVERIHSWVVMRDPAGLLFCVINAQHGFETATTTWG